MTLTDGMLSTNGGIASAGAWDGKAPPKQDNGFEISWTITHDTATNLVTYVYGISGEDGANLSKSLSHFIIETSYNFTDANLFAGTTPITELRSPALGGAKPVWEATNTAGIKWDTSGDPAKATFTIVTDRLPILGTFYAKSGNDTWARPTGEFWVPDTAVPSVPVIPLPAAVWGGLALLAGLAVYRMKARHE